jgi:branched-chain amino acid transport system ATP-binding protein
MDDILRASDLTMRFGGLLAVQDVTFALRRGEILGLIGPNGAGKSTLVGILSGVLTPTAGDVIYEGHSLGHLPAYRRAHLGIARTFQIMKPFPGLTALDNVALGALFGPGAPERTLAGARAAAREQLAFVGLAQRSDQLADALGAPDRKRLELAKALAMKPRLLLLDEVMAGLNTVEIEAVIDVIRRVQARGISILVIEHVMKAIKSLAERLMVLHHGQMIAMGDTAEVLADPRVTEAYLGKRRQ